MDGAFDKSEYTEDFEYDSSCRTTENMDDDVSIQSQTSRNFEFRTDQSVPILANSHDFESVYSQLSSWKPEHRSKSALSQATTRYSRDSFESSEWKYSQTFESIDGTKTWSRYSQDTFEIPDTEEETTSTFSNSVGSALTSPRKDQLSDNADTSWSSDTHTCNEASSWTEYESDSDFGHDDVEAKSSFISKKIQLLRLKKAQPSVFINPREAQADSRAKGKTSKHLKKFCERKLEILRNRMNDGHTMLSQSCPKEPVSQWNLRKDERVTDYGISSLTISRLRAQNTLKNMKKAASVKVHDPKICKTCRKNVEEMAHKDFLKRKMAVASEKLIEEKINKQLYKYSDPISLMKEGLEELPKLSDDPKEIFQKLCKPLREEQSLTPINMDDNLVMDATQTTFDMQHKDRFWERYFKPLESCSWFPPRNKTSNSDQGRTEYYREETNQVNSINVDSGCTNAKSGKEKPDGGVKAKENPKPGRRSGCDDSDFSRPSSCSTGTGDEHMSDLEDLDIRKYKIAPSQGKDSFSCSSSGSGNSSPIHQVCSLADLSFDDESPLNKHFSKPEEYFSEKDSNLTDSSDKESGIRHSLDSLADILDEDKLNEENVTLDKDLRSSDSEFGVNVFSIGDLSM